MFLADGRLVYKATHCEKVACKYFKMSLVRPSLGPGQSRPLNLSLPTGDKELIQEVLFDAVVSAPIEAYWTSLALNKSE